VPRTFFKKGAGHLSVAMAAMALGATLCFHFPSQLTTPQLREIYPVGLIRVLIWVFIVAAVALAWVNAHLKPGRSYAVWGAALAGLATLLGGGSVEYEIPVRKSTHAGFDWFMLDLLILSVIFVPLERIFALRREQPVFREGWQLDLKYFFVNHVLVQLILFVTAAPAVLLTQLPHPTGVAAWPAWAQLATIILTIDFFQYWIHRAFHQIPWLWRFHAVHHSIEKVDWLAGSRLHIVDTLVTRALLFVPLTWMGFDEFVLKVYLVWAAAATVFIHANVRGEFRWLGWLLATPAYHHWHHSSERPALDRNFAVHLPVLDRLFGTQYFPRGKWPKEYGVRGEKLAPGYFGQLVGAFRGPRR
jgi:lathosterol oxidase